MTYGFHDDDDDDFDLSPEIQAEVDALREKMQASTTKLDVSPEEYLEELCSMEDIALMELFTDRAFGEWRLAVEYSRNQAFLEDVVAFISAKNNVKALEGKTRILVSVARNGHLSPFLVQQLLDLSASYKLDLEGDLAGTDDLSDEHALRLAKSQDSFVHYGLAHNRKVPHVALKYIAGLEDLPPNVVDAILDSPSCTPEIRQLLPEEAGQLFDSLNASRLAEVQHAEYRDPFWDEYEATASYSQDLTASLNPGLPEAIASYFATRRDEVGARARHMIDTQAYSYLQEWAEWEAEDTEED